MDFDPHEVAKLKLVSGSATSIETVEELDDEEIELDFEMYTQEKTAISKRLKKHGRKGRKGRDKNPYEDSDLPTSVSFVHVNSGGKKNRNRDPKYKHEKS